MAQKVVADIRGELAKLGVEFTAATIENILHATADAASLMGGYACIDCGEFWGIEVEVDLEMDPEGNHYRAGLVVLDEDEDEAEFN